jgi:NAD-dependent SIR2 family protein deacetylase
MRAGTPIDDCGDPGSQLSLSPAGSILRETNTTMARFKRIVILTGAGISAESGIATFRDKGGIWAQVNVEDVATPQAFARDPRASTRAAAADTSSS